MEAAGSYQTTRRHLPQGRILHYRSIFPSRCVGEWRYSSRIAIYLLILVLILFNDAASGRIRGDGWKCPVPVGCMISESAEGTDTKFVV